MYCSQCGTQVPDDSAFCHECGAAVVQPVRPEPPGPAAAGERRFRLHPGVVGAVAAVGGLVVLLLFLVGPLGGDGGLGGGSNEDQVSALIRRSASLWNDGDWRGMYELTSPTDRETCSFEDFRGLAGLGFLGLAFLGGEDIELRDIDVTIEGDTAYASYDLYIGGEFVARKDDDEFIREDGRWYDRDEDYICAETGWWD